MLRLSVDKTAQLRHTVSNGLPTLVLSVAGRVRRSKAQSGKLSQMRQGARNDTANRQCTREAHTETAAGGVNCVDRGAGFRGAHHRRIDLARAGEPGRLLSQLPG